MSHSYPSMPQKHPILSARLPPKLVTVGLLLLGSVESGSGSLARRALRMTRYSRPVLVLHLMCAAVRFRRRPRFHPRAGPGAVFRSRRSCLRSPGGRRRWFPSRAVSRAKEGRLSGLQAGLWKYLLSRSGLPRRRDHGRTRHCPAAPRDLYQNRDCASRPPPLRRAGTSDIFRID